MQKEANKSSIYLELRPLDITFLIPHFFGNLSYTKKEKVFDVLFVEKGQKKCIFKFVYVGECIISIDV